MFAGSKIGGATCIHVWQTMQSALDFVALLSLGVYSASIAETSLQVMIFTFKPHLQ